MIFQPDIIVASDDGVDVALVVEVKSNDDDLDRAETQIKRYMLGRRCPTGLIVTPTLIRIYRDQFLNDEEDSIARVGEFPTPRQVMGSDVVDLNAQKKAFRLESLVQTWLERLATHSQSFTELPADLSAALEEHVLPALFEGEVRAAGPRVTTSARALKGESIATKADEHAHRSI